VRSRAKGGEGVTPFDAGGGKPRSEVAARAPPGKKKA
jgi:hypothetical protein